MDKQRAKGSAQQAKGNKQLAGTAVGNRKLQAKGKAEKADGKIRNAVGGMNGASFRMQSGIYQNYPPRRARRC
jgi:uncharacterized protein YjbJ (UPF0337 family)